MRTEGRYIIGRSLKWTLRTRCTFVILNTLYFAGWSGLMGGQLQGPPNLVQYTGGGAFEFAGSG